MKALDPYRWAVGLGVVILIVSGLLWYRHSLIQEGVAREKAKVAEAVAEQKAFAEAQTRNLEEVKNEAIAQAVEEAKRNAVLAARNRSELDRLRKQTGGSLDLSRTSHAACVDYATTATGVLEECGSALVGLAEKADGHVTDLQATRASWPAWDKFAEEMTDFQSRLQAFNSKGTK